MESIQYPLFTLANFKGVLQKELKKTCGKFYLYVSISKHLSERDKVKVICKMLITFIIIEVCTCSGSMAANK